MRKELYRLWLWLAAPQQLHYINGADTLPPPLPPEQLHPELLLKTLIAQGQCRLGHMKPLCRLGDGIAFRNGNHIFQLQ